MTVGERIKAIRKSKHKGRKSSIARIAWIKYLCDKFNDVLEIPKGWIDQIARKDWIEDVCANLEDVLKQKEES